MKTNGTSGLQNFSGLLARGGYNEISELLHKNKECLRITIADIIK